MAEHKITHSFNWGVKSSVVYDDLDADKFLHYVEQDVEPILEANEMLRNDATPNKNATVLARIPAYLYEALEMQKWDDAKLAQFLNDPDYAKFRVHGGRA